MTSPLSLKIYDVLIKHVKNESDARTIVEEIEQIVSERFSKEKEELAPRAEIVFLRKEMELLRQEIRTSIAESEGRIKSEINKLIVWIIGTMLASGALFITLAKVFFDK